MTRRTVLTGEISVSLCDPFYPPYGGKGAKTHVSSPSPPASDLASLALEEERRASPSKMDFHKSAKRLSVWKPLFCLRAVRMAASNSTFVPSSKSIDRSRLHGGLGLREFCSRGIRYGCMIVVSMPSVLVGGAYLAVLLSIGDKQEKVNNTEKVERRKFTFLGLNEPGRATHQPCSSSKGGNGRTRVDRHCCFMGIALFGILLDGFYAVQIKTSAARCAVLAAPG
jgi:hypothetical protein